LYAKENCPAEIKLLLSPPTIQTVIASLGFEKGEKREIEFISSTPMISTS